MRIYERHRDTFTVSTDRSRLDVAAIHQFLSTSSYWALGRPRELVERSIAHSLCFGLYAGAEQIGFARAISDLTTFAYLADVYVLDSYRGRGLGTWLIECVLDHPDLQEVRRVLLATRDAHSLYAKFGLGPLLAPEKWMERFRGASDPNA